MGFMKFFSAPDINDHMKNFFNTPGAVLIDVRTTEEYNDTHIDNSISVPLSDIEKIEEIITDRNTPLFIYCRSGNRSGQAASILKQMGYTYAKNIGGIMDYKGEILKGY